MPQQQNTMCWNICSKSYLCNDNIFIIFFNNSQDADSLCCYTLAQLHCWHVVFVLCAGEVKQINKCLHMSLQGVMIHLKM